MYLVKLDFNWADEFDVKAVQLMTQKEVDEFQTAVNCEDIYPFESYYGSNEFVDVEDSSEITRGMTITEISDEEAMVIEKYIGKKYGMTNVIYSILDRYNEVQGD